MTDRTLHQDAWIELRHLSSDAIVVFRRTSEPFTDLEAAAALMRSIEDKLEPLARTVSRVLVDTRRAPLRNDPEFEALSKRSFEHIIHRFERVAVVVATAVGQLQTSRLKRERGLHYEVFTDEAAAMQFLRG